VSSGKGVQGALRDVENRWANAIAAHDIATIQGLLAGDYIGVTAGGNIVNKAGLLAEIRRDKNKYESVTNARVDVRIHGSTAVIVGTTKQRGTDGAGKSFSYTYRWTDTWAERDGQWQCIASQSIRQPG
jgi:ketosteroid isomerase-like protein